MATDDEFKRWRRRLLSRDWGDIMRLLNDWETAPADPRALRLLGQLRHREDFLVVCRCALGLDHWAVSNAVWEHLHPGSGPYRPPVRVARFFQKPHPKPTSPDPLEWITDLHPDTREALVRDLHEGVLAYREQCQCLVDPNGIFSSYRSRPTDFARTIAWLLVEAGVRVAHIAIVRKLYQSMFPEGYNANYTHQAWEEAGIEPAFVRPELIQRNS